VSTSTEEHGAVIHEEMFPEFSGWLSVRKTHTVLASTYRIGRQLILTIQNFEIYIPILYFKGVVSWEFRQRVVQESAFLLYNSCISPLPRQHFVIDWTTVHWAVV
jgi:hypothetical protein